MKQNENTTTLSRAQGCLLGQLAGDALGSLVEFETSDTNAAICGALLGAVYGLDAIPAQWVERVLNCRPEAGAPNVKNPRPECFWPVNALELAKQLLCGK